jgi:hypothetical protein
LLVWLVWLVWPALYRLVLARQQASPGQMQLQKFLLLLLLLVLQLLACVVLLH